ncbi:hypothetical protein IKG73_02305 [Candidatus Saccharibacteria bacterium]|nr:hypothetical protein [Candidatus Saccharibacteria bacterium]
MNDKEINIKSPDEVTLDEKSYEPEPAPESQSINPESSSETAQTPEVPDQKLNQSSSTSQQNTISALSPEEPPKESHKSRNIFIAVIALVFVALGTATTVAIINHNNNQPTEEPPKNSEKPIEKQEPISELKLTGNSLSDFDLEFLKLENEAKNKIYSPLSIKYALAMLKDGAAGESKTQIENLIGNYVPKLYLNNENRSLANALFVRDTFQDRILSSYIETLNNKYAAAVIADPFVNAININNWISEKTLGIIPNLVQDDLVQNKDFILANALAIDMNWNYQIQCEVDQDSVPCLRYSVKYNHEDYSDSISPIMSNSGKASYESIIFNGQENTKTSRIGASINNYDIIKEIGEDKIRSVIKQEYTEWLQSDEAKSVMGTEAAPEQDVDKYVDGYMERLGANYGKVDFSTDFTMYDDENVKVFAKDLKEYDGSILQYIGIMPKVANLGDYIKTMTAENTQKLIDNLKPIETTSFKQGVVTKIKGNIPLFHYNSELQLMKDLKDLGVEDVFDQEKADLSNLATGSSFISDAIHVADIDFSNNGIKAAAVTLMAGLGATGAPHFEHLWEVPVEEIDLTFDKPFIFLIRDKATGEVWFTGAVYEPLLNN